MITLSIVIFYIGLSVLGISRIQAKGQKKDLLPFVVLIAWCAYLSLGNVYGWPFTSTFSPILGLFVSAGRHLEQWMGGPPNE
ncbi:hypothetical protein [Paenibacillus rigui]|uniref:Uncharacterized protein n=1 Tax=Paenibacillus rigui TaxID=554312 RepID=A0A229UPD9_9BACL|nr:hypothetical protein [Paenibacillus rigui]OXM85278.1 hypothetical protein CF651_16955 [Paenibacillus rigui]